MFSFSYKLTSNDNVTYNRLFLGYQEGSDEIVPYSPTVDIDSTYASNLSLSQYDIVHVTITCINRLNFRSSSHAKPVTIMSNPPAIESAYIRIEPHQYTYFAPRHLTQEKNVDVSFMFGGFIDNATISHYEYMMQTPSINTEWISIGKQVGILLSVLNV